MDAVTVGVMQGLSPEAAALVAQTKENVKLAQTLGACGFAVCLWDTLAYLHIEYRVVWKAKWSFIKASYLFTRYITLLTGIMYFIGFFATFSPSSCGDMVKVFPAIGTLPLLGCTLILIARAYKLWDNVKLLLASMLFLAVTQEVGQLAVAIVQTVPVPVGNGVKACVPTTKGTVFVIYWIFPAIAHIFLTLFTLLKAWKMSGNIAGTSIPSRIWSVVFSRYGLIFPSCIVLVEITQIIFYLVANDMQRAILSPLSGFLISVLACQMVLIYRLTSKSSMSGYDIYTGNTNTNALSSKGPHPSVPTIGGRLGGVLAFVTSHQAIDDAKDMFRTNPASSAYKSAQQGKNRASVVNIVPQLPRSTPFSSSPSGRRANDELSDADSLPDDDLKAFPGTKGLPSAH